MRQNPLAGLPAHTARLGNRPDVLVAIPAGSAGEVELAPAPDAQVGRHVAAAQADGGASHEHLALPGLGPGHVVQQRQLARNLLPGLARAVLLLDAEQVAEQLEQRQVWDGLAVRGAVGLVHRQPARAAAFDELCAQPALADARLTDDRRHAPRALQRVLERGLQRRALVAAANEA